MQLVSQISTNDTTEGLTTYDNPACSAGTVDGADVIENAYELKKIKHVARDSSFESIKYDIIDLVDPIRLAAVGDRYPYHTSTQGVVLYKKRGSAHSFLKLHWTVLSSPSSSYKASNEGELQTKRSLKESLSYDPGNTLVSCTEEEAFDFLYSLYGSNRNSDVTDEEIDQILKIYLPNKSISR